MTIANEEMDAEVGRLDKRRTNIAKMSDAYLDELIRVTKSEFAILVEEAMRRKTKCAARLVEFPCTLLDLETAIHAYGDHHGFHGKVVIVPVSDARGVNVGIGIEEQA